ncbi:hypothetical protein RMATCC62417_17442 [Rhizopus microsporus]|nr:hypothetical protein RMATCC62417_17442 [Rhizopus microsporus]
MIVKSTLPVLFGALFFSFTAMGKKFTPAHLIELPRPTAPVTSPNGTFAVYSQSAYNIEDSKTIRSLYLLNIETNSVEQLTEPSYETSDSEPFFLDDSHIAYFHHDQDLKEEVDQLYVLNLADKSPYRLTDFPTAFGNVKYNVDHKLLAFSSAVYPDDGTLEGAATRDKEIAETKKDTGMVFDHLMVRHWDSFVQEKKNNIFVVHLEIKDNKYQLADKPINLLKGSGLESPIFPLGDAGDFAISPDASQLAFLAKSTKPDNAWQTSAHIYLVSTKGNGSPKAINDDIPAASSSPYFAPSGLLVYFQMMRPQYESDRNRITVYDLKTDKRKVVAESWDSTPHEVVSDGKALYVTAEQRGRQKIFAIDLQTEQVTELTKEKYASGLRLLPSGNILFTMSSMKHPVAPYILDIDTKQVKPLTIEKSLAQALADIDFSEPEDVDYVGAMDEQVHGWYLKPAQFEEGKKYPLAVLIHGGPQSAWNDNWSTRWNPQIFAGAGYGVVAINFHGSTGYGQNFTDSIGGNWGSHPFHDIETGVDHILTKYDYLDPERVAGLGASYGGYMANWINGHSDKFKVLVNHDGMFSTLQAYYTTDELYFPETEFKGAPIHPDNRKLYEKWSPANYVHNWKTPTLFIHGGRDYRLTTCESLSAFTALQRQGIESRFLYFPDENHWVLKPANSLRWHKEVLDWINKHTQQTKIALHYQSK